MVGPLILLTALLDLSSACPLNLEPAELVHELGEPALINCTTTDDGHRGLYWTYNGEKQEEEDSKLFTELTISKTEWSTKANCTIKLETSECSKELQIKVFKRPSNITVHSSGAAVEGKQLELKCEVSDVATVQNLTVKWFMNNTVEKTTPYPSTNSTTTVSSSLTFNVSREHQGTTFTCEASESGPHGPLFVSNETWKLSVEYGPQFENHEYNIQVNKSDDISLHCEAMGNPPPHYSWIKDGKNVANYTNYYNISQVNENATFDCMASNDHGNVTKTFIITVMETTSTPTEATAAPKSPGCPLTIAPDKIQVKFGGPASANCSTTELDAEGLSWEATTRGTGLTKVTHLPWTVDKVEIWTISARCVINRQDGSQCTKPLSITVWKSPDKVQLSPVENRTMIEGKPQQLKCDVFNVAPAKKLQVNWYQDGKLIHTDNNIFNGSDAAPKIVTSHLEVTPEKAHNGANFTCEAELLLEENPKVASIPFTANVQYKPSASPCLGKISRPENVFKLEEVNCEVQGNPEPTVSWYYKDKEVNSTKLLTRTDSGKYTALYTNSVGNTSVTVDITIEYGPSFSCKDLYNVTENSNLDSVCVPEGKPQPDVKWVKDGKTFSSPKMWKREDSGRYMVVASNALGRANHTVTINVLYAPRFSDAPTTEEINQGGNRTLKCSADGNPPPQVEWKKYPHAANIKVTSRERQSYVHITEATSADAGLYSCFATNEVGSVSKNVTLMIITEQSKNITIIIIISVVIAVLFIILALILIGRVCKKKFGRYDILALSEVSMTTMS